MVDIPNDLLARTHAWMWDKALPFWADRGLDRVHGGVLESLSLDATGPSGVDFKRTRVVCRQLYVFSHAAVLGWKPAAAAADHCYAALVSQNWMGAGQGWARLLTATGAVRDSTPDLYDYAFALFALGWRLKAGGDRQALTLAHQTLDLIETRFAHPGGLGYWHELPAGLPRQQNPHMHLTEAALVLAEATGEARFFELAGTITDLFTHHLCRLPEGVLPEFFTEDWQPVPGDQGRWTEPGHQFEWAWIMAQHQKLTGTDHAATIAALVSRAEQFGVDQASQVTFNGVRDDGLPLDRGSRSWPNTERIKGWIGHAEVNGAEGAAAIAGSTRLLLDRYLDPAPPGCWLDAFDADGRPVVKTITTSTLYHVFLAFAELQRAAG